MTPGDALPPAVPQLTGARCDAGLLRVFGTYHVFDYNLFYSNIRANAVERAVAYRASHAAAAP